jgi:hypothetical protein
MRYIRIISKAVEVASALIKVLGGNWAAVFGLVAGVIDLHAAARAPGAASAASS